ncbi:RipA family octameric membrane protein [bacterium endosymbiont of Bathymodiolus sp. 5 South]|jgi:hypothetical protein|uniref:RipA family octameric membrane protein n=1 Tax=bacterium endosymbiont of Bathymodiolus sp. 5 South TaxID=1181670 RepID=UPI0010B4D4C6|nr:hypothetical protein [uncultured Gammaproteobacteria bacterium]SHN93645.1 hypothetical protein BCLUESOX_826 [bacterium endosymbiont of Bathymodiolus sp. 5 South]VVH54790.1 hypothetical protein BSPCLSOX_823 [uncultured Gammaproteobacteria bacterium]
MPITQEEYGDNFKPHLLEQYKLYVEMADRISGRRQSANSFFLSVNTAIIAAVGYVNFSSKTISEFYCLISFAGIVQCYIWFRLIRSYKDLNSAKFKVIHELESLLPVAPYDTEWNKVESGRNSKLYLPFTHIEAYIPWVFLVIHFFVFCKTISLLLIVHQ